MSLEKSCTHLSSRLAIGIFDTIVHPGVYAHVGLPTWKTWRVSEPGHGRMLGGYDDLSHTPPLGVRRSPGH